MPTQKMNKFLPPFVPHRELHPAKTVTMGFAMSDYFAEIMKAKMKP